MIHVKIFFILLAAGIFGTAVGATAAPLQVTVSILPQKWLIKRIGADKVSVQVLVDNGQEPHNFAPTPRQLTRLFRSKIYFTLDMAFERQVTRKIQQSGGRLLLIDCTRSIHRIPITDSTPDAGNNHGGHGRTGLDPHVWLAPVNLIAMAETMASELAAVDPAGAALYAGNLKRITAELRQLDSRISLTLAADQGASFFVFHPAFGYFAHAYGLHQEPVEVAGKSPSPKQLRSLIQKARREKVKIIFVQPQFDARSARAVARAIGGEVVPLDPLAEDVVGNLTLMAEKIHSALSR
jgi:zinc transport system substrate-binding protein